MYINAWLEVQCKTAFGMVEEDAAVLIDLVLKNMNIEAFKGERNIIERDVYRYL
jgi:hypothetical protein